MPERLLHLKAVPTALAVPVALADQEIKVAAHQKADPEVLKARRKVQSCME